MKLEFLKAKYEVKTEPFFDALAGANRVSTEARFLFDKEELLIEGLDPANVYMFHTTCPYIGSRRKAEFIANTGDLKKHCEESF